MTSTREKIILRDSLEDTGMEDGGGGEKGMDVMDK